MMLGRIDESSAVSVGASVGRGGAHAVLSGFLWFALCFLSCRPALNLRSPYVVLRFAEVAMVVEDANSPQEAVSVGKGSISFSRVGVSNAYDVHGEGFLS